MCLIVNVFVQVSCAKALPQDDTQWLDCYAARAYLITITEFTASLEKDGLQIEDNTAIIDLEPFAEIGRNRIAQFAMKRFPNSEEHLHYFIEKSDSNVDTFVAILGGGDSDAIRSISKDAEYCSSEF